MKQTLTRRAQVINLTNVFYYSPVANGNIVGSAGASTAYLGVPRTYSAGMEIDF
jgi:iron complex outermembrane receptor protein